MICSSWPNACKIYDFKNKLNLKYYPVQHKELETFCLSLRKFKKSLHQFECLDDDYWSNFLYRLRKLQFEFCAAPLSFNYFSSLPLNSLATLKAHLKQCEVLYPQFNSEAVILLEKLENLLTLSSNPLFEAFLEIYLEHNYELTVLLLKESRLIPPIEELLSQFELEQKIKVLVSSQLRSLDSYDKLIIIGSPYWFPEYILTAPRTSEIEIVHYHWIRSKWKQEPVFPYSLTSPLLQLSPEANQNLEKLELKTDQETILNVIEPDDIILPHINWSNINQRVQGLKINDVDQDNIDARLFLLENRTSAVFLDIETKVFVIDLYEEVDDGQRDSNSKVKKIKVTDIQPDMFILLRTGGGGDYIIPVANQILRESGENVEKIRHLQQEWKNMLKNAVKRDGLEIVSQRLVRLGSQLAKHEINIRNWISSDHIRPRDDTDFEAILNFLQVDYRIYEFMKAANLIKQAHQKAGHHIRQLLLHKITHSELTKLEQLGVIEFELEQADGVSMTAFRVVDIDSEIHEVPASEIEKVFEL